MELENEEPNSVVPRPCSQEPLGLLERSSSLDVTPERVHTRRKRPQRRNSRPPPEGIKDESQPSVDLSIPQLNSTAQVLNQLHALKSQQIPGPSSVEHDTYPPVYRLPMLHGGPHVGGLEDMGLRPYMETNLPRNVPRNISRYKDLVPIDMAEESIRKLTFIPRKERTKSRVFNIEPKKEPRMMDLMVTGLEREEADWSRAPNIDNRAPNIDNRAPSIDSRSHSIDSKAHSVDTRATRAHSIDTRAHSIDTRALGPESDWSHGHRNVGHTEPNSDDVFTLYSFITSLK